jgi:hypothetical protein
LNGDGGGFGAFPRRQYDVFAFGEEPTRAKASGDGQDAGRNQEASAGKVFVRHCFATKVRG